MEYKRILAAMDLGEHSKRVLARAKAVAGVAGAELKLLHVVEYVPVEPMGEALLPAVNIEEELVTGARKRLAELARDSGLEDREQQVIAGTIKSEVLREAREWPADLVVLGSRERHGLALIVNLTEDAVLHAAPCDVLAVRLPG
ncbi:universal stress protein [Thioalkalivibrio sp. XN279]|uniref:universal stress protein n=1 Tax=Thioalkalivibrio sp. XN279 TaxID=2714953 RepID=UPI00140A8F79|nr:universal stress protein [Thioalkalivibrio sp. XN279]NHA15048.1 universal stress protein [Thioalkalivibrio sp. XN279]